MNITNEHFHPREIVVDSEPPFIPMNLDQQVASTNSRPPTVYDQKYVDFVDNVLKEAADDFEREKKCT